MPGIEVVAFIGVALYAVAFLFTQVQVKCEHECKPCKEAEDLRVAKNILDRHNFEHMWWKISEEDCDTCKRLRRP